MTPFIGTGLPAVPFGLVWAKRAGIAGLFLIDVVPAAMDTAFQPINQISLSENEAWRDSRDIAILNRSPFLEFFFCVVNIVGIERIAYVCLRDHETRFPILHQWIDCHYDVDRTRLRHL